MQKSSELAVQTRQSDKYTDAGTVYQLATWRLNKEFAARKINTDATLRAAASERLSASLKLGNVSVIIQACKRIKEGARG